MVSFLLTASGCASTQLRQDAALIGDVGVNSALEKKILRGRALIEEEIVTLRNSGVPDQVILRNLDASWAVYDLKTADVERLKAAGVSEAVIDAMLISGKKYGQARASFHNHAFGHRSHVHGRRHHRFAHRRAHYHHLHHKPH